jgi:hypothetical protein
VIEELQEGAVGPVLVLEQKDERPLRRDRLEIAPPGGERFVAGRACRIGRQADERGEPRVDPVSFGRVGDDRLDACGELCGRCLGVVGLEDPGLCLDDLA